MPAGAFTRRDLEGQHGDTSVVRASHLAAVPFLSSSVHAIIAGRPSASRRATMTMRDILEDIHFLAGDLRNFERK
ncbi:MAG: hypothetical protein COY42_22515 [Armatimonadetes bacterium CG_4_10_14_0_8_um_filter_66_14]|nr:MAG: hypothetical protein COS65_06545 [Armatimonadetes bacterium CG06_land_8_20_14_3_00_66_21]PIX46690.1 MAG: hypothetical protein COZ57_10735 [Armatimonadetes bacterium CG_4_8_14_3_um_filter_66_20]PIZ39248.1 MAG: hypothetical protein COY42_22515 [Armatimonadetes bacterium CG_4_10_14_0_8_um_filter_66_14]